MSSPLDYGAARPPPPPPPAHPQRLAAQTQTQTSPLRRAFAIQPPGLITTALAPPYPSSSFAPGSVHSPASATSLSLPFSSMITNSPASYAPSPAAASPMALRNSSAVPYNPQQWNRSGPVSGQYVQHPQQLHQARLQDLTGMEAALPSPPPPYSPSQNPNLSQALSAASPHSASNPFASHTLPPPPTGTPSSARPVSGFNSRPTSIAMPPSASTITANPHFPPPPSGSRNAPGRSSSRDKLSSKFGLASFRNRASEREHSPSPNSIESLHIQTSDAILRAPASSGPATQHTPSRYVSNNFAERRYSPDSSSVIRAPAARRAASAGVHGYEGRTPIDESPVVLSANWNRSTPLPPPPPGPPPSSSRSQSEGPDPARVPAPPTAPPTRRFGHSTLGPIPPTPQGWQDEPLTARPRSPAMHGLHIDTSQPSVRSIQQTAPSSENETASVSSGPTVATSQTSSTLHRSNDQDEQFARGIRERRSESRAARERAEVSNNPWSQNLEHSSTVPANLDLCSPEAGLARRGAVTKGTPRSSGAIRSPRSSRLFDDPGSSNSTPRMDAYQRATPLTAATPPFSPGMESFNRSLQKTPIALPSKALPTPPLHSYGDEQNPDLTMPPGSANRVNSHKFTSSSFGTGDSTISTPKHHARDAFAQAAIDRHRHFIEKEMAATNDQDRLELFAEFIVTESRFRRDRYSAAFDAMAGDIVDLTRDLWRSYGTAERRSTTPNKQGPLLRDSSRSQTSVTADSPDTRFSNSLPTTAASPASSSGHFTPNTAPESPSSASSQKARDPPWNNNFLPSLSPIPSMAMSTVPEEESSRGRSASRWWESDGGSSEIGGNRRLERSKRESKYMSLPKEARENLQWAGEDQHTPRAMDGSSNQHAYGPNEYPPEKVGLHEQHIQSPTQSLGYYVQAATAKSAIHKLDVSRLVTLPPPYPRHHPAVNNNHPELTSIRTNLRTLATLEEIKATKVNFSTQTEARKEQDKVSLAERRVQTRHNIQENVRNGIMSFADAAKAEADFEGREQQHAQEVVQHVFDSFQSEVANPLHALFCERITKLTASMEHLKSRLSNEAQEPNQTQEEGDESPELLEMLTLLKWFFDAREQMYKEMFELEDERNDLYKDIIVLPYIQADNDQKVKEAKAFFRRDAQDRKVTFEKDLLKRYEAFVSVIEQNVSRGAEAQLSAFWDIAPGLVTIVQRIPERLQGFEIVIPQQEFNETPAYHDYPLQYLYTLLAHAGRSAYQFIESQTNLLCLLHEAQTGVMTAGSRLLETQRLMEGEDATRLEEEMTAVRADEERRLTDNLKEKVGLVENQWREALGGALEDCKNKVEEFLAQQGGWDDSLRE